MATKRGKKKVSKTSRAETRRASTRGGRPAATAPKARDLGAKPAARPPKAPAAPSPAPPQRPAASTAPRASTAPALPIPSLLDRAARLRDAIRESKLTAPDPWGYTAKARGWTQEAQALVDAIARGDESADALARRLDALAAQVEGDPDYQEARRRT